MPCQRATIYYNQGHSLSTGDCVPAAETKQDMCIELRRNRMQRKDKSPHPIYLWLMHVLLMAP